ncbi:MAG: hypothetical protein WDO70_02560 [Alphaproteobacteria bacterium]
MRRLPFRQRLGHRQKRRMRFPRRLAAIFGKHRGAVQAEILGVAAQESDDISLRGQIVILPLLERMKEFRPDPQMLRDVVKLKAGSFPLHAQPLADAKRPLLLFLLLGLLRTRGARRRNGRCRSLRESLMRVLTPPMPRHDSTSLSGENHRPGGALSQPDMRPI